MHFYVQVHVVRGFTHVGVFTHVYRCECANRNEQKKTNKTRKRKKIEKVKNNINEEY